MFRFVNNSKMVSLENVIVKEGEDCVVGTVKVSNLSFLKEVVVRWTSDQWNTHEDVFCKYVANGAGIGSAYSLFDTFSFKLNLPPRVRRVEFCVCFRCEGKEYWDNNGGRNYIIVKKVNKDLCIKKETLAYLIFVRVLHLLGSFLLNSQRTVSRGRQKIIWSIVYLPGGFTPCGDDS